MSKSIVHRVGVQLTADEYGEITVRQGRFTRVAVWTPRHGLAIAVEFESTERFADWLADECTKYWVEEYGR